MNAGTEAIKADDCDELKFGGSRVIDDKKGIKRLLMIGVDVEIGEERAVSE